MTKPLPFISLKRHLLPPPLSCVLDELVDEQQKSGIHTTADETAEAIETWYRFLGALLLAEYLDSGAISGGLNRWLFSLLRNKRPILSGTWIAIGRACHSELVPIWIAGRTPTWDGLTHIDLGNPNDKDHPVSRLITYRNHFGHGSFAQVEDDILEYGHLLEQQIQLLADDLIDRPINMVNLDGKTARLQGLEPEQYTQTLDVHAPTDIPTGTAFVEMPDGQYRMLAPAIQLTLNDEGHWSLSHSQIDNKKKPLEPSLLQQFSDNLQRYRYEQSGHLSFDSHEAPQQPGKAQPAITGIDEALKTKAVLTLVNYRPGTGQFFLAENLWALIEKQATQTILWRVIRDTHEIHPSLQGSVFARALLRQAEKALALEDNALEPANGDLLSAVASAGLQLTEHKKQVSCVLMDAEQGIKAPASDPLSIIDICKSARAGFQIMLLAPPSKINLLPHDGPILQAQLPEEEHMNNNELQKALSNWLSEHRNIRITTLQQLITHAEEWKNAEEPLHLAIESVEQELNQSLFAPAVEHALWTAAPFIETHRNNQQATYWKIPDSKDDSYKKALQETLTQLAPQGGQ